MADIISHHMIYGTIEDYLTGEKIVDTDDERYRQKLAVFLVEEKGYSKENLLPRQKIETLFSKNFVISRLDLIVCIKDIKFMVIRYGPGSLVTRERSAIAAARVLVPDYQIPYAVVTNGVDAEFLDTVSGRVLALGMQGIPDMDEALGLYEELSLKKLPSGRQREMELRILNTYDKEVCCAGDPCILPNAPEG